MILTVTIGKRAVPPLENRLWTVWGNCAWRNGRNGVSKGYVDACACSLLLADCG